MIKRNFGKVAIGALVFMVVVLLALCVGLQAGDGTNQPSSKVTAQVGYDDIDVIELLTCNDDTQVPPEAEWETVLSNTIKTPNQKDLFIDVSMVSTLLTDTQSKSKRSVETGEPEVDTTTATSGIKVRVVIDLGTDQEEYALPGEEGVVFAKRIQKLSVLLQGFVDVNDVTGDLEVVGDEFVQLMLETMSANAFNFIAEDLGSGVHTIDVQVSRVPDAGCDGTYAQVAAIVGHRSMTVESVRLIKYPGITDPPIID